MRYRGLVVACFAPLLGTACGVEEGATVASSPDETNIQAALIGEDWVAQADARNLTEPFAFTAYGQTRGGYEIVNTMNGSAPTETIYSCDIGQGAFTTWQLSVRDPILSDTSGIGKGSLAQNSPWMAYQIGLSGINHDGIRWLSTSEPCPATGIPVWTTGTMFFPSGTNLDYPEVFYDNVHDQGWITFTEAPVGGQTTVGVLKLTADGSGGTIWVNNCDNHSNAFSNGVIDDNGDPHLVYLDETSSTVRHVRFDHITQSFVCPGGGQSPVAIGPHSFQPSGNCSDCPTTSALGTSCLRDSYAASIAFDPLTLKMVVAYGTRGNSPCDGFTEMRMYQSLDQGASWSFNAVTGCQNAVQPRVTAAYENDWGGLANVFHINTTYNTTSGSYSFAQVDWNSQDGGATWNGGYVSPGRTMADLGGCYWGDYQGIAADLANNNIFENFSQPNDSFGYVGIRGLSVTP